MWASPFATELCASLLAPPHRPHRETREASRTSSGQVCRNRREFLVLPDGCRPSAVSLHRRNLGYNCPHCPRRRLECRLGPEFYRCGCRKVVDHVTMGCRLDDGHGRALCRRTAEWPGGVGVCCSGKASFPEQRRGAALRVARPGRGHPQSGRLHLCRRVSSFPRTLEFRADHDGAGFCRAFGQPGVCTNELDEHQACLLFEEHRQPEPRPFRSDGDSCDGGGRIDSHEANSHLLFSAMENPGIPPRTTPEVVPTCQDKLQENLVPGQTAKICESSGIMRRTTGTGRTAARRTA